MLESNEVGSEARRLWESGRVLSAWLGGEELFPWVLKLGDGLPEDSIGLEEWKSGIEAGCKCGCSEGYRIEYREIEGRRLPRRVVFDTVMDLVGYLDKGGELAKFARLARKIRGRFPALKGWIARNPMEVLEQREAWPRLLALLEWLVAHPGRGFPPTEVVIPGVDDEFVAGHRELVAELLDQLLPKAASDGEPQGP